MKTKSNLKKFFIKSLIVCFLLTVSAGSIAQKQQSGDLKDFKIIIENTGNGINLKSLKGSAWINLSFSIGNDKPQAIDEYGMTKSDDVSPAKDANLADYLFTLIKTENGIILKGIEGTAWNELSFTLSKNGKQTVDQYGMTE